MPISKFSLGVFASLLGLGLAGCAGKPRLVYVDLARVQRDLAAPSISVPVQNPSAGFASTESLPALGWQSLAMPGPKASLDRVEEIRAKNRARALRELESRLYTEVRDHTKLEAEQAKDALLPGYNQALDEFYARARAIFLSYANPSGAVTLNLTEIVGFPDPDPKSRRIPDPLDKRAVERFDQAKDLRASLSDLSARYWSDIDTNLGDIHRNYSADVARIDAEFATLLDERMADAKKRAASIVTADDSSLPSILLGGNAELPALPRESATVASPTPALNAITKGGADWRALTAAQIRSELSIWAAVNGYQVAPNGIGARDATQEFIVWRKGTRIGL